jgi:flagella basal body P-ring formation protein FlgA
MIFALPIDAALVAYATEVCHASQVDVAWTGVREGLISPTAILDLTGDPCRSRPELRVSVIEDDVRIASFTLRPSLIVMIPIAVSAHAVKAGETIVTTAGHTEIGSYSGQPLTQENLIAKRDISQGTPITSQIAMPALDAQAGDSVDILVHVGDLTVKAAGQLLTSGTIGEPVRVKNIATGSAQRATLTGPNTVELTR